MRYGELWARLHRLRPAAAARMFVRQAGWGEAADGDPCPAGAAFALCGLGALAARLVGVEPAALLEAALPLAGELAARGAAVAEALGRAEGGRAALPEVRLTLYDDRYLVLDGHPVAGDLARPGRCPVPDDPPASVLGVDVTAFYVRLGR